MIRKVTLDFKEVDVEEYLFPRIPVRFQGTDPRAFEDFIAHLFTINGYQLKEASYSPDFGADLIVDYAGESTAIQIKRYHESHKVGVAEINQLIGAKSYYRCDDAMMITTSSFDKAAKKAAEAEAIILWDWYRLHQMIADTFLEGNYDSYFEKYPVAQQPVDADLGFRLISIDLTRRKLSLDGRTIVNAELENRSDQPLHVYCDLPVYVTHQRKQFAAIEWTAESFRKGEIYGKAVVPISFSFSSKQLSKYHRQDRIILKVHSIVTGESVVMEQKMKKLKKECFFITLAYGRDTAEYRDMIKFRDEVLRKTAGGRIFTSVYYKVGRRMVSEFSRIPYAAAFLKPFLSIVVSLCRLFINRQEVSSFER